MNILHNWLLIRWHLKNTCDFQAMEQSYIEISVRDSRHIQKSDEIPSA